MSRYPSRDPKPDSVAWEMARRAVAGLMRRTVYRVKNPGRARMKIHPSTYKKDQP